MKIKEAHFITSSSAMEHLPVPDKPEYAFIGRSNVGKSSLINMLAGQKHLAKTSKKPGRTRTINHFLINKRWYLVDLPGYGFAKTSKKAQKKWLQYTRTYLQQRQNLQCVFMLIDGAIPPQQKDMDFINWMGEHQIPFVIVLTKVDKVTSKELEQNIQQLGDQLATHWEYLPEHFATSATKQQGRAAILDFIENVNDDFQEPLIIG